MSLNLIKNMSLVLIICSNRNPGVISIGENSAYVIISKYNNPSWAKGKAYFCFPRDIGFLLITSDQHARRNCWSRVIDTRVTAQDTFSSLAKFHFARERKNAKIFLSLKVKSYPYRVLNRCLFKIRPPGKKETSTIA